MASSNKVRVVVVDATNKTVREQWIKPELQSYYKLIDCTCMESFVRTPKNFEEVIFSYIDEHGGFTNKSRLIVKTKHGNEMVIGNMVIIGTPDHDGEETDCPWSVDDVLKFISFEPVAQGFSQ